jgi:hypothetical protein
MGRVCEIEVPSRADDRLSWPAFQVIQPGQTTETDRLPHISNPRSARRTTLTGAVAAALDQNDNQDRTYDTGHDTNRC